MGLPDYIVTMRKPGINPEPVSHGRGFERYIGDMDTPKDCKLDDPRVNKFSHKVWQRYASPVWFDINQTRTLNINAARHEDDEKHVCPLQLDTIARCLELWTNEGDVVLSPFAGIGSEGYEAVRMGRRFIGIELKRSYYDQAVKNLLSVETAHKQLELFA
jgi:DNA modification methylase